MSTATDHRPDASEAAGRADRTELARRQAVKQIERKRHFHVELVASAIGMVLLVTVWATSEYQNAGGWPTQGFSQSSGIHDVWNSWIIYPLIGWALVLAARGWSIYGHKPISEHEIEREMSRQQGGR